MILKRSATRACLMLALIVAIVLPAWAAMQRLCVVNVSLPNAAVPGYRLYAYAGIDNGTPTGRITIGPPAWDDKTLYFSGDVYAAERTVNGVKLAASGTFGTRVLNQREPTEAFVTVEDGKITVAGLPPDYNVSAVKSSSGSISIYPVATANK